MSAKHARLFLILLIFHAPLFGDGTPPDLRLADPRSLQVDLLFDQWDSNRSPGCAVGVYRDGKILHERGYGMANLEYGIALTPESAFRTASVSKQFTAMVILLLEERGELSLDDTLDRYFPDFPAYAKTIRLRHMLHHTSGIRDYLSLAYLGGLGEHYTNEEAVDLLRRQEHLNFAPGEDHLYSNSGFFLLAQIIDRLPAGKGLAERAEELIFDPLGMEHTHYQYDSRLLVPNRVDGYEAMADGTYRLYNTGLDMIGDGGVFTTVHDLLRWHNNFEDNRLGGGAELIERMTTRARLNSGEELPRASGLLYDTFRGVTSIGHSGSYNGFNSGMVRFPDRRLGVAVLCNRDHVRAYDLTFDVAEIYLDDLLSKAAASDDDAAFSETERAKGVGDYRDAETKTLRHVYDADDSLYVSGLPNGQEALLRALGDGRYLMNRSIEVRFEEGAMVTDGPDGEKRFVRVAPESPKHLERYEGIYYCEELDVRYRMSVREGRLVVSVPRLGEFVLVPQASEAFVHGKIGLFVFAPPRSEDPSESAQEFELDAGPVRNLRFVRTSS